MICILLGLVLGLLTVPWISLYGGAHDNFQFPTAEMISRGELRCLWVGVLIAVPSGAGVALSVLGGNAGSLVGVAISASLLPPAVNCGIFWAASIVIAMSSDDTVSVSGYTPRYDNDNMPMEAFYLGLISLFL